MEAMPDAAIGTDLIVGFPGETSRHFDDYFKFVRRFAACLLSRVPVLGAGGNHCGKVKLVKLHR